MHTHAQFKPASRRGITLLEVLMAMFVLAVGILSIFGLFTAGRELEARAAIKSDAIAYAATICDTVANGWVDRWRDWLYVDAAGSFARVGSMGTLPTDSKVALPVLIDPCGLADDTQSRSPFLRNPALDWDWARMTPLNSGTTNLQPFARITLPLTSGGLLPLAREGAIASVSDQDAIEYELPANDNEPPRNLFELGRRKRGSDLVPALFVAASGASIANPAIVQNVAVSRTLLIFNKASNDLEEGSFSGQSSTWPAGYLELEVQSSQDGGLLEASITRIPKDTALVRRSLRPGNWLLVAETKSATAGTPPYWYETQWVKIKSATPNNAAQTDWLLVVDVKDSVTMPASCYAFERLVHVVDDLDPVTLPPP